MYLAIDNRLDPFTFRIYVEFAGFGDDNLSGVSIEVPWFNAMSYAHIMKLHGIVYTSCSKGNIEVEYENIDDVTYLKRTFVYRNGWMHAPLDKNSIHEMLQWCRPSSITLEENMQATFNSFCQEMVHYGKSEYNEYVNIVMSTAQNLPDPIKLIRNDYKTLYAAMRNKCY
jgi:hypothetical protein